MMKSVLIVIIVLMMVGVGSNVYGAQLFYDPGSVSMELAPGGAAEAGVKVISVGQREPVIYVNMKGSVTNGNLPLGWVGGKSTGLSSAAGSVATLLSISVPEDAEAGTYYGVVMPSVQSGRERVTIGSGVYVSVEVAASCQGAPVFEGMSIGPDSISARNNKTVVVTVTGRLSVSDGCETPDVTYKVVDEYKEADSDGPVTLGTDGSFIVEASVNASRHGDDKDGRTYTITVDTVDSQGNPVSEGFYVTVGHDSRDARDKAKSNNGKAKGKDKDNGPSADKGNDKPDKDNNGKAKGKDK